MKIEEAIRLAECIRWKSADRDNMEFEARVTCYQRDAIGTLIEHIRERDALIGKQTETE